MKIKCALIFLAVVFALAGCKPKKDDPSPSGNPQIEEDKDGPSGQPDAGIPSDSSSPSSSADDQKKDNQKKDESLSIENLTFPDAQDPNLLKMEEVPEGDYGISDIETQIYEKEHDSMLQFRQKMRTIGTPAREDRANSKKELKNLKLKTGDIFWPFVKFNLPFQMEAKEESIHFSEVNEYGNQWFSEKPDDSGWQWWWNEAETANIPYLYRMFSEGTETDKIYLSDLGGQIKNGRAAIYKNTNGTIGLYFSYQTSDTQTAMVKLTYAPL